MSKVVVIRQSGRVDSTDEKSNRQSRGYFDIRYSVFSIRYSKGLSIPLYVCFSVLMMEIINNLNDNFPFGPVYWQFERKGQKAVNFLLKKRNGEVPNALFHPDIGWIDLFWGVPGSKRSDGYGLAKIEKYHPEVMSNLAEILKSLKIISKTKNRYKLEDEHYFAVVSRMWFEDRKTWLLTLFDKL